MEDVIIVGAGPAGLFSACELARHGVKARVIERSTEHHGQARGTALQPGTLEMLDRAGVVEPLLARGVHVRGVRFCGPGMEEMGRSMLAGIDAGREHECSQPQSQTEDILYEHLLTFGVDVELGVTVTSVEDKNDHVELALSHKDGRTEVAQARYVIGAGGSHSVVRASMPETELKGLTYEGRFIVADVRLGITLEPEHATVVISPKGIVLMAPLPDHRYLIFVDRPGATDESLVPTDLEAGQLVNERAGVEVGIHDVRWISPFRMHKRMAAALADGARFLVGDSGHASSPLGGHGLNTALMDAADLGWKLALVIRGRGKQVLLESYAYERAKADTHALEVSDTVHSKVMGMIAAAAHPTDEPEPAPDEAADLASRRSKALLDVSYEGSPLVAEHVESGESAPTHGPAPGERYPDRSKLSGPLHHLLIFGPSFLEGLEGFTGRWGDLVEVVDTVKAGLKPDRAGVPEGGLVLIRPDGYIGFRSTSFSPKGVDALEAHLESYLIPQG